MPRSKNSSRKTPKKLGKKKSRARRRYQKEAEVESNLPTLAEKLGELSTPYEQALDNYLAQVEENLGGRQRIIDTLIRSSDQRSKQLIMALGRIDAGAASLYQVIRSIGLTADQFMRIMSAKEVSAAVLEAQHTLAQGLPGVMEATLKSAQVEGKDGHADRKMVLEMAGLLKKDSPMVAVNLNQNFTGTFGVGDFEKAVGGASSMAQDNPFEVEAEVIEEEEEEEEDEAG